MLKSTEKDGQKLRAHFASQCNGITVFSKAPAWQVNAASSLEKLSSHLRCSAHLLAPTSAVKYHVFLPVSPIPACAQEKKEAVLIAPLINAFGFVQPFMLFWFKLGGFGIHPVYVTQAAQDYMDLSS